jgi:hypothetical protein
MPEERGLQLTWWVGGLGAHAGQGGSGLVQLVVRLDGEREIGSNLFLNNFGG